MFESKDMQILNCDRWYSTWRGLDLCGLESAFVQLQDCYREPHRAYHTLQHLAECFEHFESVRSLARHPAEVELALWYHDAIYDPQRHDNEDRSRDMALAALSQANALSDVIERVAKLILATKHATTPIEPDAQLVVDVDLAILAAASERFDEYERQVRQEYVWVPWADYCVGRSRILAQFLDRPRIYLTDWFHDRLEQQARMNLQDSIRRLQRPYESVAQSSP